MPNIRKIYYQFRLYEFQSKVNSSWVGQFVESFFHKMVKLEITLVISAVTIEQLKSLFSVVLLMLYNIGQQSISLKLYVSDYMKVNYIT